ncbi:hypothetical protein BKA61DRAFT_665963 [Leptodontidium sp. MPI-SDFR-AT-0119]|nr:hypothetical protein BKA61DRAFT_665963 [Leptodontidium sp. MPI-SDFR-AT-0119]
MSNHQQQSESENEADRAYQLISKQQNLQPPASQDTFSLNSQQAPFIPVEPASQNEQYPNFNLRAPAHFIDQAWWMYYGWYQDSAHISPEIYLENNLQRFDRPISVYADPVFTPPEVPDQTIETTDINPEMYDKKNPYRHDGKIFIDDDSVVTPPPEIPALTNELASTSIEPAPFTKAPYEQITTNIAWKDTPEDVQRRRSRLEHASQCKSHPPAPGLESSRRIPNTPRKDTIINCHDLEYEMTVIPVEEKEGKLASDEVLRRGVWPAGSRSPRESRWKFSCWAPGCLTVVCRGEERK